MIKNILTIILLFSFLGVGTSYAIVDTYYEDFDVREDEATIDGIDYWNVEQGVVDNAVTQDDTTYTGEGKALEIIGTETAVSVSRSANYGDVSPCWIEFKVKPGIGAERRSVPTGKIAALSFDYTGKIYASDGSTWVDTGETFTEGEWYRVMLKLDFITHAYDIYIQPAASLEFGLTPDKENLDFIDSTISSLSQIGFGGAYNTERTDDVYIDDLIVHFIDRLGITAMSQTLIEEQASNAITVQLQNAYYEPQTAWQDITLELRSSSGKGEFSLDRGNWHPISHVIIPEDGYGVTFYYRDFQEGNPIITATEYPDRGWQEASWQVKIVSKAAYFDVVATSPQIAGEEFTVVITAKDEDGEINRLYDGEVEIFANYVSPDTGTMQVSPNSTSFFQEGTAQIKLIYPDCGTIEILARDSQELSKIGSSGEIIFIPAEFSILAESPQVVSKDFKVSVYAFNAQGQVCPNYQGPAGFSVIAVTPEETDGTISPATIDEGDFLNGIAEKSINFNRWGRAKIEVNDVGYPQQKGVSQPILFKPKAILIKAEPPSTERNFWYIGETIDIDIPVVDELNLPIPNYMGLINISSTLGLNLPDEYQFTEEDEGKYTFSGSVASSGWYEVWAQEEQAELKSESIKLEVKQASLEVVPTVSPIGTTEVTIKLTDEEGNIITSENELTLTVELEEEFANSSATASAVKKPVTFNQGISKILVSDTQAEMVTIMPSSEYDFKVKKGTVTFGRISKTGIGTLMWRELKE